jgi:uncharacterized protein (DUF2225 family)
MPTYTCGIAHEMCCICYDKAKRNDPRYYERINDSDYIMLEDVCPVCIGIAWERDFLKKIKDRDDELENLWKKIVPLVEQNKDLARYIELLTKPINDRYGRRPIE